MRQNKEHYQKQSYAETGFVLVTTLFLMSTLLALLGAYFVTTNIELASTRYSRDSAAGFAAAEAGLNLRAEVIRDTFVGYNLPTGTSPTESGACEGGNTGTGDFSCDTFALGNHDSITYVNDDPDNPLILTIPPGELYQNLNAQEYRYTVNSMAKGFEDKVEAILELRFKSRLVPLFQFAAFYDKDLEILPGPSMTLEGPVHTNGDLYLNANNSLAIDGQVTAAGDIYRGRKNDSTCKAKPINIYDPGTAVPLLPSCSSRTQVTESDISSWNGMIQIGVDVVTVPGPEVFDPSPGAVYWDSADLRIVLVLDGSNNPDTSNSSTGVEIRATDDSLEGALTTALDSCAGDISGKPVGSSSTFYNNREAATINMLEIDMQNLLNCIHTDSLFGLGKDLNDTSDGGLVFHFTVKGPDSAALPNTYGVRVRNGAELQSNVGGAPIVKGVTIISDQAFYTHGNYNSINKIPAAIMGDAFNVLSNNWNLDDSKSTQSLSNRTPSNTTINSAVLAGTDTTGGIEGAGGQNGAYNGGLENYPRMHENWSGKTLTYYGSFVSLGNSQHSDGAWKYGSPQYNAPGRDWHYDTDFNNAANLPPITPRFVYLRQELFVREFEQ